MNKKVFRIIIIVFVSMFLFISSNASSLGLTNNYLPIIVNNFGLVASPSSTAPSPTLPTPTQTQTSPAPPVSTGLVEIRDIFFNGAGTSEPDEYVLIENDESFPIQLQNWTLRDEANHIFTFPSFVIQPNQQCRIYTNENHPEWCGFNYGSGTAIWNNSGDTAYLRNSNGTLIDDYSY